MNDIKARCMKSFLMCNIALCLIVRIGLKIKFHIVKTVHQKYLGYILKVLKSLKVMCLWLVLGNF
jgi:hypothetical protein